MLPAAISWSPSVDLLQRKKKKPHKRKRKDLALITGFG